MSHIFFSRQLRVLLRSAYLFGKREGRNENNISCKESIWNQVRNLRTRASMKDITNPKNRREDGMSNCKEDPEIQCVPEVRGVLYILLHLHYTLEKLKVGTGMG